MLGFFLNAISIVSFLTVKEMRNPSNFFVFNLAVADLCLNINGLTAAYASYIRYERVVVKTSRRRSLYAIVVNLMLSPPQKKDQ